MVAMKRLLLQVGIAGWLAFAVDSHALELVADDPFGVEVASPGSGSAVEGAALRTDSEVDELLDRADQFAKQGRFDLAGTLWQTVIDSSNDLMFTRDDWITKTLVHSYQRYRSVAGDIESTLGGLPEDGLQGYRIKADAEAKLVLAKPSAGGDGAEGGRESALAEIVRRYFLSSIGDDAAFELACRKLDRYEFRPAIRLLDKILGEYPEPSVEKDEVLLRLAALSARVGDVERSQKLIADLRDRITPSVPDSIITMVEEDIAKVREAQPVVETESLLWPMLMGGASRLGIMNAPEELPADGSGEQWTQPFALELPDSWPALPKDDVVVAEVDLEDPFRRAVVNARESSSEKKKATPESLLESWEKHLWRPSGTMIFHGGRMYFKNHNRLVCANSETGTLQWLGWRTHYPYPTVHSTNRSSRSSTDTVGRAPAGVNEVRDFSDSIHQSMAIVRDKILTLQGRPMDFTEESLPLDAGVRRAAPGAMVFQARGQNTGPARMRDNRLVAYHARNGKLQWTRSAAEPDTENPVGACFAGPPVPYGALVLIPVLEGSGMYLTAIETDAGVTRWRRFLADEPVGATVPTGSIVIAVEGGEAYVSTGAGLVFSVDAISGAINWASRYPRSVKSDPARERQMRFGGFNNRSLAQFEGWAEEMIVASGRAVVVAAMDFDHLFALDRRDGSLLWESACRPSPDAAGCDYVLGIRDGMFYAAGREVVRGYRVDGGRMMWETAVEGGFARGMLTDKGIFVPSGKDKIMQLDLSGGKKISEIDVEVEGKQPLGNLFSDGERLYGFGLQKAYAIGAIPPAADKVGALADEFEALMDRFLREVEATAKGEPAKLKEISIELTELSKRLQKLPVPESDKRSELARRFKDQETKIGKSLESVAADDERAAALKAELGAFSERIEKLGPVFKKYGFESE